MDSRGKSRKLKPRFSIRAAIYLILNTPSLKKACILSIIIKWGNKNIVARLEKLNRGAQAA